MKYVSTRGGDTAGNFREVVLAGLAKDGGLFVPESYPQFSLEQISSFRGMAYHELAFEIIYPFAGDSIPAIDLRQILKETYSTEKFFHPDIAPLKELYDGHYLLELFHGPTLAFKDFALQLLGRFFDYFLQDSDSKINILGATSGDTGSAAIAGCAASKNVNIFILHPHGKVSEVQRRQMTTITGDNIFNIALKGNFDDCQNMVKAIFNDLEFKQKYHLTAVNSINWARIVAQIVYYFYAALKLGAPDKKISFSVPTGNFGDILAGYIAKKMGLPIERLIIATNSNDILHRFIETGTYKKEAVEATIAPSMDIQISSNFERLLFEFCNRNSDLICSNIKSLSENSKFKVEDELYKLIRSEFSSARASDKDILSTIKSVYAKTNEVLDPHTAAGFFAAEKFKQQDKAMVTLATAHPAKFADAVEKAINIKPKLADHLSNIFELAENYRISENEILFTKQLIIDNN